MIKIESEQDLEQLKKRLYRACDKRGIRLGKAQNRINEIMAEMLGFNDYNTCIAHLRKQGYQNDENIYEYK